MNNRSIKVCVCTTPIRPVPTTFPPLGSLSVMATLRKGGIDTTFYNIDYHRPTEIEIERFFSTNRFSIVGISAVVSTAYRYTKDLAALIKTASPETLVVVGGNLAASSELILRKTLVDVCVIGDGEYTFNRLVKFVESELRKKKTFSEFKNDIESISGLAFLNNDGQFTFTGFSEAPSLDDIDYPDYSDLVQDGSIKHYIHSERLDSPSTASGGSIRTTATVITAKGCVARCTFCHRWEKGYRINPLDRLKSHILFLKNTFNVNHIDFGDENFGSNKEFTAELVTFLAQNGFTWKAAGVRVKSVTFDILKSWKSAGCEAAYFGIESGSDKILKIMEKKALVEDNLNALKATSLAEIHTIVQLVIGMPGESDNTIAETIEFLKKYSTYSYDWADKYPSELISINYAQALPGTPLYEWARENGFVGQTLEEEEAYLLKISDTDAYDEDHVINYTDLPMLKILMWRQIILSNVDAYYFTLKTNSSSIPFATVLRYYCSLIYVRLCRRLGNTNIGDMGSFRPRSVNSKAISEGYFNIHSNVKFFPLLLSPSTRLIFYPMLAVIVAFWRTQSVYQGFNLIARHLLWSCFKSLRRTPPSVQSQSLRKVIAINSVRAMPDDQEEDLMLPLRRGR
jgi:anaerobic magnesium-protoporphyrin IX monomethyl ester cyclase